MHRRDTIHDGRQHRRAGLSLAAALILLLGLMPTAIAQESGPWPQYSGDPENSRQGEGVAPGNPGLQWHTDLADEGYEMSRSYYGFVGLEQPVLDADGTVVTRAEGSDEDGEDVPFLLGLDGATGAISWERPEPDLRTRCTQAIDSQGRLWSQRSSNEGELFAVDPTTGSEDPAAATGDTVRCYRTALHIGGSPEHLVSFDNDGFGVYDISGTAPAEQWVFDDADQDESLLRWGGTGSGSTRLAAFTDDSVIVPIIDETGEDAVAHLVQLSLDDGGEVGRVEIEVLPDSSDEANPSHIRRVHPVIDGDTLVVATYVSAGAAFEGNGSIAAYDISAGLGGAPDWLEPVEERGEPLGIVRGNGEVFVEHRTGALTAYDTASGADRLITENPQADRHFISDAAGDVITHVGGDDLDLEADAIALFSAAGTPQWAFDRAGLEAAAGLGDDEEFDFSDAMIGPMDGDGSFLIGSQEELAKIDASGGLDTLGAVDEDRVSGADRIETSVQLAREFDSAETVVLARSDQYPDALAGAPLAAHLEAPILLTPSTSLAPSVASEIDRLGAEQAVLLGGEAALSAGVESAVQAEGLATDRYDGEHRWDTAAQIAADLPDPDAAFVVRGQDLDDPESGWEDAVAVSALAARTSTPILLTLTDTLPEDTADALAPLDEATVVGGTAVVSTSVEDAVAAHVDTVGDRLAGADRYATSAEIADASMAAGMDPSNTWIATGRNFPDSLAAAPVVGATAPEVADAGGVLLLVDGHDLSRSDASEAWLQTNAAGIDRIRAVGGTAVVTDATLQDARDAAGID